MLELAQNAKYFICNWKDIKLCVSRGIENMIFISMPMQLLQIS